VTRRRRLFFIGSSAALVLIVGQAVTQLTAGSLGYQPALGPPAFRLAGFSVYRPWNFVDWELRFRGQAPQQFSSGETLGGLGLCLAAGLAAIGLKRREPPLCDSAAEDALDCESSEESA
jgi:hypothetical protein